jgi:hypothetical protein
MQLVYIKQSTIVFIVFCFILLFVIWTNKIALLNIIEIKIVVLFIFVVLTI